MGWCSWWLLCSGVVGELGLQLATSGCTFSVVRHAVLHSRRSVGVVVGMSDWLAWTLVLVSIGGELTDCFCAC